ncbi:MAG: fibronectin type III domain-containing protein, partial [Flavobacteriales bacterium]|nr:fibronectin type III domain-containing protein [Flavobacteriales bacterium]
MNTDRSQMTSKHKPPCAWKVAIIAMALLLCAPQMMAQTTVIIGTNSGANTTTSYPCPLGHYYQSQRAQYLYTAAELSTAGITNGMLITEVGWVANATTLSGHSLPGYTISMLNTAVTALAITGWESGATPVYGPATYSYPSGYSGNIKFPVSSFTYTGGNLLVEVCHNAPNFTSNPAIQWSTAIGFNGQHTYRADVAVGCGTSSVTNTGTRSTRPRLVLSYVGSTPCTVAAPGNTMVSGTANFCTGTTRTLSTQQAPETGITHQWQSSPDNSIWTDIAGATNSTLSVSPVASTWYRDRVTCAADAGNPVTSTPIQVAAATGAPVYAAYDGVSYSESFESWVNGCNTTDRPSASWNATPATGNNSWRRNDQGASAGWSFLTDPNWIPPSPPFPNGNYCALFHTYGMNGTTPGIMDLYIDMSAATGNTNLKFWYINPSGTDNLKVSQSTNGGATFTQLGSTLGVSVGWSEKAFTMTSTSPTTVLRISAVSDYGADDLGIDDLRIQAPLVCEAPSILDVVNLSATSVSVNWSCPACTGQYYVEYGPVGFTPGTGATANGGTVVGPIAGTSANLTGLTTGSNYQVYLRQDCGGSFGPNSSPYSFLMDYCTAGAASLEAGVITNVTYAGINNSNEGTVSYQDFTSITGTCARTVTFPFSATATGTSTTMQILVWADLNHDQAFDASEILFSQISGSPFSGSITVPNTALDGTTRMRVRVHESTFGPNSEPCGNSFSGQVEDYSLTIQGPPTCDSPTGLGVTGITANGATISWNANASTPSGGYQWEIRDSGSPGSGSPTASNTTPGLSEIVNGLSANTAYSLYVRADCGGGDLSFWSGPYSFTTACGLMSLPYTQNFNSVAPPAIPNCMGIQVVSGNPWTTVAAPTGMTGNAARYAYAPGAANSWLFTDALGLTSGTTYRLTYVYGNNGGTTYPEKLAVAYGTSASAAGMTNALADHDPVTTPLNTNIIEFTPGSTGAFYIGFQAHSIGDQFYLYLDDISVMELPPCSTLPTPGATTGPTSACAGVPFTLGITNESSEGGISYQWETSPNGSSWSNAPGVSTNSTYVTSQTATTWYRCQVTCAGNGTAASSDYQVTMSAPTACYCTPVISFSIEPICNVTFSDINNTSSSTVGGTPAVEDFTAVVGNVKAGSTYTMSLTGNSDGSYTNFFTAFFDWDQDGTFETAVPIGSFTGSVCTAVVSGPVTIPLSATAGPTRMRVIKNYGTSPVDPCGTYAFGQAEDYTLNVTIPTCFAPVATVTGLAGGTATINWTNNASASYNWELRDSGLPGDPLPIASGYHVAAGPAIIPGLTPGANYTFYIQG